ncbi:hypothetical protein [Phycicoccus sp. DTK01]|uniref:hypothetical protein n=1 Tax=Phycicoccus sp. DTK01 TaxID=2785745 RepID=UPI001A8F438B|nr:hypothetical protein [Phycicoccus sp. DTK01]
MSTVTVAASSAVPAPANTAPAASGTSSPPQAADVADGLEQPSTTKIVEVTEDNDPNDLIGRPNGYDSAAVIYDSNATCTDLGVECGATVEVWPDEAAAKSRSDYIQSILEASPVLGSEFHTLAGPVLLRVDGKQLKPSLAEKYAAALTG